MFLCFFASYMFVFNNESADFSVHFLMYGCYKEQTYIKHKTAIKIVP